MIESPTYYEQWGPLARRVRLAGDRVRFAAKASLGLRTSILVELRWRLGDEIMALPIFAALRAKYPQAHLAVLTNYPDLFRDLPCVDDVNPPAPAPDRYYLLRGAPRDRFRLEHYAAQAEVEMPETPPRLAYRVWETPLLEELPAGDGPLIAFAPGASWTPKRWPEDRWREAARRLENVGCRVIVLGNDGEDCGCGTSFVGRTGVYEAAVLLHRADVAVTSDSGLMHLARACGTRTVALFGPTDPDLYMAPCDDFVPMGQERACAGCWNRGAMNQPGACPLDIAECLEPITPESVVERVVALLPQG